MCDCYWHPCKVCGKLFPVHLGDFDTARNEIEVYCWRHRPRGPDDDVKAWRFKRESRREFKTTGMAIKALTDNARANWDKNEPNTDCEGEEV